LQRPVQDSLQIRALPSSRKPYLATIDLRRRIIFFLKLVRVFLRSCFLIHQKISMADTGVVDLDAGVMVEKHGRGRPRGSKNKSKAATMDVASSSAPVKRCPCRPLGSKNKPKSSAPPANESLDANVAHRSTPPPPTGNTFSFFAFTGA
jgi:hypothetical protein